MICLHLFFLAIVSILVVVLSIILEMQVWLDIAFTIWLSSIFISSSFNIVAMRSAANWVVVISNIIGMKLIVILINLWADRWVKSYCFLLVKKIILSNYLALTFNCLHFSLLTLICLVTRDEALEGGLEGRGEILEERLGGRGEILERKIGGRSIR